MGEITAGFFGDKNELGPDWVPLSSFDHANRDRNGGHSEAYKTLANAIRDGKISARQKFVGIGRSGGRIYVIAREAAAYLEELAAAAAREAEKSRPAVVKAEPQRDLFECRADVDRLERIERSIANLSRSFAEISESIRSFMDVSESPDPVRDGWVGSDGRP